jgi:hypothetical protein
MKLTAPEGRTGLVQCSASGTNYHIDEHGRVDVDARDVADLLRAGFSTGELAQAALEAPESTFAQPVAG